MKIFKPELVDNVAALKLLKQNSKICKPYIGQICKSYRQYLHGRADPKKISPLNLPDTVIDELYEFYKAERKRDGLQWIGNYRSARELSHCPLCGNAGPSQLEHYLPRSPYAEFTTLSWNLIPCCGLCNGKRSKHGNAPGQEIPLIHPYFDERIFGEPMLSARIKPPYHAATFEPIAVGPFAPDVLARIERQIGICVKVERFSVHLQSKWNIWRGKASKYRKVGKIRKELKIELQASVGPTGKNSWDVAFLRALLADELALKWLAANGTDISSVPFRSRKLIAALKAT